MNKNLTEMIGTFFLVIAIGFTGNPIAVGCILMLLIYLGGSISGAHYNPAVTLAVLIRKRITLNSALQYWIWQILGAFLAAFVIYLTCKAPMRISPAALDKGFTSNLKPLMIELIFTFVLAGVVLIVAFSKRTAGNNYYGLAISFTVLVSAYIAGPISGGAFNPAVAIGPMLMDRFVGGTSINNLWIYLVGPFAGAAVAAVTYKMMNPDEE